MTKWAALLAAGAGCLLAGCSSFMPYDEQQPEEYQRYWSDPGNVERSILYSFTDEAKKERDDRRDGEKLDP